MRFPQKGQKKKGAVREMKRLVVAAAIAALSAGVFAAEGGDAPKAGEEAKAAGVSARSAKVPGVQFDRAKFMERMKKRGEERRTKVADILKAAGLAEDKVGGAVEEIDKVYARRPPQRPVRSGAQGAMPKRPARQRPQAAPAPAPEAAPAQK